MQFEIGAGSTINLSCKFDRTKGLTIGQNCVINAHCRMDTRGDIIIGDNVSISEEVIILTVDHDMNTTNFGPRPRSVIIEDYVFIGTRAMILPGIKIERGAIIAAGAIVTKDVKAADVVAGIPAKKITTRPDSYNYTAQYRRLFK